MFQRIIVAFDGSPRSEDALALALRLRDPADGILTLACCVSEALVDSATQPVVVLPRRPHREPDRPAPAGATTAVEAR
jgi:nucleotide-binding universal stress UspA family protein